MVADATDQILQVLVEHTVDTALDHLEGHRGGPWASASEGNPAAAAALGGAGTGRPHLRRQTRCVSGRRGKDDVEARATAVAGDQSEEKGQRRRPRFHRRFPAQGRSQMAAKMAVGQLTEGLGVREAPPHQKARPRTAVSLTTTCHPIGKQTPPFDAWRPTPSPAVPRSLIGEQEPTDVLTTPPGEKTRASLPTQLNDSSGRGLC